MTDYPLNDDWRAARERSRAAQERAAAELPNMLPKERFDLARAILRELAHDGVGYDEFMSAQAATRYIRRASRALEGIG